MNIKSKVIAGLSWTAGSNLIGQIITWSITIIVMRILAPADYGLLAIASIFVAFLSMMTAVGLGPAIVQVKDIDQGLMSQLFGLILSMNALLFLVLFVAAPAIANFFDEPRLSDVVRALSLQFVVNAFATIPEAMLGRALLFKIRALIDLAANILGGVVTLTLAMYGCGVWSLVVGSLLNTACRAVGLNIWQPYLHRPRFSLKGTRKLLVFGGNVTAARLLWFFYSQADMFVAGKLLGKEVVGLYSVAMHLASLPVQKISGIINQVAFPAFATIKADGGTINTHFLKGVRLLSFFSFPVLWGISAVAPDLVALVLGKKWMGAVLPLQMLPAIMPLRMISNFLPAAVDAVGRPDVSVKNLIAASLVMPAAFVFGSQWGVFGLCLAWLVAFPVIFIGNLTRALPVLQVTASGLVLSMYRPAIAAAGMYLAVGVFTHYLASSATVAERFTGQVGLAAFVYLSLTVAINREGLREVRHLFKR